MRELPRLARPLSVGLIAVVTGVGCGEVDRAQAITYGYDGGGTGSDGGSGGAPDAEGGAVPECELACPPCGSHWCGRRVSGTVQLNYLVYDFLYLEAESGGREVREPFAVPFRRDGKHVLLVLRWLDLYASEGCYSYCTGSGVMYLLIDVETDVAKLVAKVEDMSAVDWDEVDTRPCTGDGCERAVSVPRLGKRYELVNSTELSQTNYEQPPRYLRKALRACREANGECEYVVLPLTFMANPR